MPQSRKDAKGGKTHPAKSQSGGKAAGNAEQDKKQTGSVTGSRKQGEKKSTP
jgi:hypothetical protein